MAIRFVTTMLQFRAALYRSAMRLAGLFAVALSAARGATAHGGPLLPPSAPLPGGIPGPQTSAASTARAGAPPRRTCGAVEKTHGQVAVDAATLMRAQIAAPALFELTIPVKFHILCSGLLYRVPLANVQQQIAVLNAAYAGLAPMPAGQPFDVDIVDTGFRFGLDEVLYHDSVVDSSIKNEWVTACSTSNSMAIAQQLSVSPDRYFNVYTCSPSGGILGWVLGFPQDAPESDAIHAAFVLFSALPGLVAPATGWPYGLGNTLVHESGHYLGLYHTFQGGCGSLDNGAAGDAVSDTPCEASAAYGTISDLLGRDTCTAPGQSDATTGPWHGRDPWSSYLDYSDDASMWQFSRGQAARMQAMTLLYKPLLYAAYGNNATLSELGVPSPPPPPPSPPTPGIAPSLVPPTSPHTSLFATF